VHVVKLAGRARVESRAAEVRLDRHERRGVLVEAGAERDVVARTADGPEQHCRYVVGEHGDPLRPDLAQGGDALICVVRAAEGRERRCA
jgi:hypothetical protein